MDRMEDYFWGGREMIDLTVCTDSEAILTIEILMNYLPSKMCSCQAQYMLIRVLVPPLQFLR